ncbi:PREDICTED: probable myosin-binding protein 5 [Nelumbo nucifera]|uniref:Probable myosin-binding protein 5 n=1 Tax=Nelumbo nucifera TaxID=4432 RepID=A0A1U8Q4J7_NELNU|nr:PREDICTED: probable myosin-binding protein 5 [Nelumbo nucifera]
MGSTSFKQFEEQKLRKFPYFFIYALFEWILIILLIIDGLIAFAANEFARFFGMKIPCLFCSRIDHVLASRDPYFYYNDSICEAHRKHVSSLVYCHVHRKLSDIRQMCEGCLLSFGSENKSDYETCKSLVGILGRDIRCSVEDGRRIHLRLPCRGNMDTSQVEKSSMHRCSCCGEPLRIKPSFRRGFLPCLPSNECDFPQAPASSPIKANDEEPRGFDQVQIPLIRYTEAKLVSDTESEIPEDDESLSTITEDNQCREDVKGAIVPFITENEDLNEDPCKTPNLIRGNKLLGVTVADSAIWLAKLPRKLQTEKIESGAESWEGIAIGEGDDEATLDCQKRQVRVDRKFLIALYTELDKERSASAVAANQAMAMITRLQAEKAAVQMEALQYQRMMEEQTEYEQKALQVVKDLLKMREGEIRALKAELQAYREKEHGIGALEAQTDDGCVNYLTRSDSSVSSCSEWGSPLAYFNEMEFYGENGHYFVQSVPSQEESGERIIDEPLLDLRCKYNILTKEICKLSERLEALEINREFLKHSVRSLQNGGEAVQLSEGDSPTSTGASTVREKALGERLFLRVLFSLSWVSGLFRFPLPVA